MFVSISNGFLTATIKLKGAELCSLKNKNKEYIWDGNSDFWGKHSPVLFPIVGTLKDNSYRYNNKKYQLNRHGFARDLDFVIQEKQEHYVIFSLISSNTTKTNYPFDFELNIKYSLDEKRLKIQYFVKNLGTNKMLFSIGGHPAFALPNHFENYSLKFEDDKSINFYLLENDLLSNTTKKIDLKNNKLALSYALFENDALVFKKLNSKSITIYDCEIPYLKFSFKDFPNFGIWTKMNAPFVCLEPWMGYSDTMNSSGNILEKEGITILNPNDIYTIEFLIEIL